VTPPDGVVGGGREVEQRWFAARNDGGCCGVMGVFSLFLLPLFFSIFLVFSSALLTMFSLLCSGVMAALLVFLLPNKVVLLLLLLRVLFCSVFFLLSRFCWWWSCY